jgi:MFS family permease
MALISDGRRLLNVRKKAAQQLIKDKQRSLATIRLSIAVDMMVGVMLLPNYPIMVDKGVHKDSFPSTYPFDFASAVQFIPMTYYLGVSIASLFSGSISDRVGRKPVMLCCISGSILGSAAKWWCRKSFLGFCTANFVNGLLSSEFPVVLAYVSDLFESKEEKEKEFSKTVGCYVLGQGLGGIIAIMFYPLGLFVPILAGIGLLLVVFVLNCLFLIEPKYLRIPLVVDMDNVSVHKVLEHDEEKDAERGEGEEANQEESTDESSEDGKVDCIPEHDNDEKSMLILLEHDEEKQETERTEDEETHQDEVADDSNDDKVYCIPEHDNDEKSMLILLEHDEEKQETERAEDEETHQDEVADDSNDDKVYCIPEHDDKKDIGRTEDEEAIQEEATDESNDEKVDCAPEHDDKKDIGRTEDEEAIQEEATDESNDEKVDCAPEHDDKKDIVRTEDKVAIQEEATDEISDDKDEFLQKNDIQDLPDEIDKKTMSIIITGAFVDIVGSKTLYPLCITPLAFDIFYRDFVVRGESPPLSLSGYQWLTILLALLVIPAAIIGPILFRKIGLASTCVMGNALTGLLTMLLLFVANIETPTSWTCAWFFVALYFCFPFTVVSILSASPMLDRIAPIDKRGFVQGVYSFTFNITSAISIWLLGLLADVTSTNTMVWTGIGISFGAAMINTPLIFLRKLGPVRRSPVS